MSWYPPAAKRRPGSGQWRAAGKRPFGATWWGKAWVDALEQQARLDPNRLPRGRTYARTGAVGELTVRPGEVVAAVQGSRAKPYRVVVRVRTYSDAEWKRTLVVLAGQVGHLAALLDGEMPPGVAADLAAAKIDLLPVAGEVQPRFSCPDWADPCKHSAAVCYLVADTLDADPFLLFLLRGRDRETVLAELRATRASAIGEVRARASGETAGSGTAAPATEQVTSSSTDVGVNAQQAWTRWGARSGGDGPEAPAIPLPPPRQGEPTVLAVDPPPGSGVTSRSLQYLARDAVQRAWELAHGERGTGFELSPTADLARRAAALLPPVGENEEFAAIAAAAGMASRDLFNRALAWRDGGSEGLAVLLEDWDPPRDAMQGAVALLGGAATQRRNRATRGDRQLRLGRDGRWYPFRRSGRSAGSGPWISDGVPIEGDL